MPKAETTKQKLPRLYRVTVSYDVLVLSHSAPEAEMFASHVNLNGEDVSDVFVHKAKASDIDQDWMDSVPYVARDVKDPDHKKDDITVKEWLKKIDEEDTQRRADADMEARQEKLPGV